MNNTKKTILLTYIFSLKRNRLMNKFYCHRVPPFEIIYEVFHKFRGMTKTGLPNPKFKSQ